MHLFYPVQYLKFHDPTQDAIGHEEQQSQLKLPFFKLKKSALELFLERVFFFSRTVLDAFAIKLMKNIIKRLIQKEKKKI